MAGKEEKLNNSNDGREGRGRERGTHESTESEGKSHFTGKKIMESI